MNARISMSLVLFALCLSPAVTARADEPDFAELVKKGDQLLDALPKKPDVNWKRYYRVLKNEKPIGFYIVTLKSTDVDGAPGYHFEYDYAMDHPQSGQIESKLSADLTAQLRPLKINHEVDSFTLQSGFWNRQYDVKFGSKRAMVEPVSSGQKLDTKKVRLPKGPYVLPMSSLVEFLPLKSGQSFALRSFNPNTHKFQIDVYTVKKKGKRLRVGVKTYPLSRLQDEEDEEEDEEEKEAEKPEEGTPENADAANVDGSEEKKNEPAESYYFYIDPKKGFAQIVYDEEDYEMRRSSKKKVLEIKKSILDE